jgi:hypothetical protein
MTHNALLKSGSNRFLTGFCDERGNLISAWSWRSTTHPAWIDFEFGIAGLGLFGS